ncbi:hypothetical protein ASF56_24940 [Methylobacterium sp. Leaf122]|nr:hypothetical protein ASF56_24940 [Methylobacterium sp. Leaf122]
MDDKLASETRCILYDHDAHTVGFDMIEKRHEAGSALDRVCAAYGGIIELSDHLELGTCCEPLDGFALTLLRMTIGSNVCGTGSAQIGHRLDHI